MDIKSLQIAIAAFTETARSIAAEPYDRSNSCAGRFSPDGVKYYNHLAKALNESKC